MDFLAICQGLGLALAVGLVIGVVVPPIMPAWGAAAGAAPLGFFACAAALTGADEPVWPAVPVGALGAAFAAIVVNDVVAGATRRRQSSGADGLREPPPTMVSVQIATWVVLAAAVLALASIFVPPVSLIAAAALAWLWVSRRRRDERKHEGLRVLR